MNPDAVRILSLFGPSCKAFARWRLLPPLYAPETVEQPDLAVFLGIRTHFSRRLPPIWKAT
jgi:hypothetical protein